MATVSDPSTVTTLPAFDNPPVVETILSVQFDPLRCLTNAKLGAFWYLVRADYPLTADAPPTAPQIETFEGSPFSWPPMFQFRIGQDPSSRLQLRSADKSRMIQVENGRLSYNWLAQGEQKNYPRFSAIKPAFDGCTKVFFDFLKSEGAGEPKLIQWEVTYVNHLPRGSVWESPEDWPRLFRRSQFVLSTDSPKPKFESFNGSWHFEIEPKQGRLHVEVQHGKTAPPESRELIALKLTARGPINEKGGNSLDAGLNLGHAIIVQSFADLTSDEAHKVWRRTQ